MYKHSAVVHGVPCASQVANWFVRMIILSGPSGDLQLIILVALSALAGTYAVNLRIYLSITLGFSKNDTYLPQLHLK